MKAFKQTNFKAAKFTLIELLVVVAIIGILASLLLPSLGKARKSAKLAVCTNTMKQMGIALALYTDDNDQEYVFAQVESAVHIWDEELFQYLGRKLTNTEIIGSRLNKTDFPEFTKRNPFKCAADDLPRELNMNTRSYQYSS
jgi:prepilin-type N-terminal cleavage/methylation domain-containing protein